MRFPAGALSDWNTQYLMNEKIPTPGGKVKWSVSTILSILQNEKYKGDAVLQKTYTVDFLTKKKKSNEGEILNTMLRIAIPPSFPQKYTISFNMNSKKESKKKAIKRVVALFTERLSAVSAAVSMAARYGILPASTAGSFGNATINSIMIKNARHPIFMKEI